MSAFTIIAVIILYFSLILIISYYTSRKADNNSFFIGNRNSKWYVVSFGMIGSLLSGVTFISVPGWVQSSQFTYMQMVLGYLVGYFIIANVLLPMYYRLNLTSIYTYLQNRFGEVSYKTGASFFLLSRTIGASFRLFLVARVLDISIFQNLYNSGVISFRVPFFVIVLITIALIWLYTNKGGIKTIIWTDTLQTFFMLLAVFATIYYISKSLGLDGQLIKTIANSEYSRIFVFDDITAGNHFIKQFLSGAFISIVMTGLDQDMMQKTLSCKNLKEAKKNMYWYSVLLVPVNLFFLTLGALLFMFAAKNGIALPEQSDDLYPLIATQGYLGPAVALFFIIGIIAAAYSSADSALTSLTTSFTLDILNGQKLPENKLKQTRRIVHVFISLFLVLIILIFNSVERENVISSLFQVAGYTYGPLLGLYSLGLFTHIKPRDKWVPFVCFLSPILSYIIYLNSEIWLWGYKFGFEILIVNGLITFIGLFLLSLLKKK